MIVKALMHDPVLLFLDEPTAGVDVELREELWDYVRGLRERGTTIVLTTHYIEEAEQLADRIGIIHKGTIRRVATRDELMSELGSARLTVELRQGVGDTLLDALPEGLELARASERAILLEFAPGGGDDGRLLTALGGMGVEIASVRVEQTSLEDIFRDLIREEEQRDEVER